MIFAPKNNIGPVTLALFTIFPALFGFANACANTDDGESLYELPLNELLLLKVNYRLSLKKALEEKRAATIMQDTIVAKDIADFADLNLAESIQRMPGVAITREGGEGRQISLRGIGANFTQAQINGMETLAISSSPMDSRNTLDGDRAFDFNVFTSELFSQIDIKKSYSVDQNEGAIGGTVVLTTPKPFDLERAQLVLGAATGSNSQAEPSSNRFTFLASNTWGEIGLLGSINYSKRATVEKGFNTTRWRAVPGGPVSADPLASNRYNDAAITDPNTVSLIENGELWFSRSNRYSVWENDQERLGSNVVVQYKPGEDLDINLSALYSRLDNHRDEYHIGTGRSSSQWPGVMEDLLYQSAGSEKEIIYAEYSNAELRSEHRIDVAKTTYSQLVLNTNWRVSDKLSISALLGNSTSNFDQPALDKVFLLSIPGSITTDFRSDRYYGDVKYGIDTTAPENWQTWNLFLKEEYIEDTFQDAKLDFEYAYTSNLTIKFGADFTIYRNEMVVVEDSPEPLDANSNSFVDVYYGSDDVDWIVADIPKAFNFYNVNTKLKVPDVDNFVEEKTWGLYSQLQLQSEIFGKSLTNSIGLRYFSTDVSLGNTIDNIDVRIKGDYNDFLPEWSTIFEFNRDTLLRVNLSKNINRPYMFEQRVFINSLNTTEQTLSFNGNPNGLDPFESTNVDLSFEMYFDKTEYFAIALFWKDISGFTDVVTKNVAFSETGLPLDFLAVGQNGNTNYEYSYLESSNSAAVSGIEFSAQKNFDFLPAPFNNLGVIGNITCAQGEADYRDVQGSGLSETKSFPGLSRLSGNMTLYYENDNTGVRLSGAYRDEYIFNVEAGLTDEDERGFHSTLYLDFSAYYEFNERFKISLEGVNLTNEREEQYSDSSDRVYNSTTSGRSVFLGFNYKWR